MPDPAADPADRPSAAARRTIAALTVLLLFAGIVAASASRLSVEAVRAQMDRLSPDGSAGGYTADRIAAMLSRAGVAGVVFSAAAVGLVVLRRPIGRWLDAVGADARALSADVAAGVRADAIGWAAVAVLAVAGAGLRVAFVDRPASPDEVTTLMSFAARPLPYAVSEYPSPNNHLLYTLLMHVAARAFGEALWAIRLPALLIGVATIPAAYLLGRALAGGMAESSRRAAGLVAAGLVAASPYLVSYSTNGRGYGAVALAFALSIPLGVRVVSTGDRAAIALLSIVWALGFFAIPTMLYPCGIAGLFLVALCFVERKSAKPRAAGLVLAAMLGAGLTILLYAPALVVSGPAALTSNRFVAPLPFGEFVAGTRWHLGQFVGATHASMPWPAAAAVALGAILAIALPPARSRSPGRWRPMLLVLAVVAWCPAVLLAQRAVPFARVWTFLVPMYLALSAVGWSAAAGLVVRPRKGRWGGLAVGAVVALLLAGPTAARAWQDRSPERLGEAPPLADAAAFAEFARTVAGPENRILTVQPARPVLQYAVRRAAVRQSLLSRDAGGAAYNFVFVDRPIEEMNRKLAFEGMPELTPARLREAARFGASAVYALDPPIPATAMSIRPEAG